jgi:hypothetical protein
VSARVLVQPYRNDRAGDSLAATFTALHALLGPRRSVAFEVHLDRRAGGAPLVWFAAVVPVALQRQLEATLRASYPNLRLRALRWTPAEPPAAVRLIRRTPPHADDEPIEPAPRMEALLLAMLAAGAPATVRLALRPAPRVLERLLSSSERTVGPLLWASAVVLARDRRAARAVASALCAGEPRLLARSGARGGGRSPRRLFRPAELAALWSLPAPEFAAVPWVRRAVPIAAAAPGIWRPRDGAGVLRDEHGPVAVELTQRRQHTAVVGAVDQGKTSFLVASASADLRREDCALIVLDPKGDAAEAVLSIVPPSRVCTVLDMAAPRAGFNPLAVAASPDAIADQVVAALRGLFGDGEVRGSSDRYLRNAVIAVLACDPRATLWDVARLLEVGEAGSALRARVADRLVDLPRYAELATFLAQELPAQLADARATTTAKLDAPANKLARVLNSPAVKRVLLNDSLRIDLDRLIEGAEVLVVRGALGEIGAGNVAVLMQLLLGMLDAALSRVQDRRDGGTPRPVALKVDEAPLAINEAFAQTLALKRSAGLETVACWQTDAQWEPELRERLDALFAHRVLFATASAADARGASALLMSEFSDQIRGGDEQLARLASPDVRLHLPRHTAIVSWTTSRGRERPFIANTMPLRVDRERIEGHHRAQHARGGRELRDPAPPPGLLAVAPTAPALPAPTPPPVEQEAPRAVAKEPPSIAAAAPPSHAELTALDGASRMRVLPVARASVATRLEPADRDTLAWLAAARCALSSQVHRRMNPDRSLTGTQRRLKRLADAGLIARLQLHREDGGGLPLACAVTPAAIELLEITARAAMELRAIALPSLREDLHLVGWLLALEARAGGALLEVLGPGRAALVPATSEPGELALGAGRIARGFLRTRGGGARVGVERFVAVRPGAVATVAGEAGQRDLLIVLDPGGPPVWLEPYDHLLGGWWRSVGRYRRGGAAPTVVVICADERRALELVAAADLLLTAAVAQIGVDPRDWERGGRSGIHFVAEADLHAGDTAALRVPSLPSELRDGAPFAPLRTPFVQLPPVAVPAPAPPPWR